MSVMVFLTSVNPSRELLNLKVALGPGEGTHWPLALTVMTVRVTQVHLLLCWVFGNTPEHDAGQHGAEEHREAARHSLDAGKVAPS